MKKALHLLNSFKRGGAENVALNYSIALNKLGIRSTFIANHKSIDYENMLREKGGEIVYKLNHDLINGADIIFIHSNINLLRLVIYKILGKLRNKKVLYIQHLAYSGSKFKLLSLLINWICTDFILITPRTRQLVNNYIKIHIEEIINFYINKYDQESYNKIRNTVRNELSIEAGTKLLMFSAIFKPGKGLDECLRLASCFINNPEIKFLIVGDGEEKYFQVEYETPCSPAWAGGKSGGPFLPPSAAAEILRAGVWPPDGCDGVQQWRAGSRWRRPGSCPRR